MPNPPTTYIIRPHAAGFFSNFLKVISVLRFLGPEDAAIVDWSLPKRLPHFPYGTSNDGNIWEHLFEPLRFANFPDRTEEIVGYVEGGIPAALSAYDMYLGNTEWRFALSSLATRHVKPRAEILRRVSSAVLLGEGVFVVGVHYRHPGHNHEAPYPVPSPREFIRQVKADLRTKPDWRVFLATDDTKAAAAFRQAFGPRLLEQSSLSRSTTNFQVHETTFDGNLELGREVLTDALALARTDRFFHIVSNVATAVGFLNPHLDMIYCRSPHDALYKAILRTTGIETGMSWARSGKRILGQLGKQRSP
jgi:hypothetical protein